MTTKNESFVQFVRRQDVDGNIQLINHWPIVGDAKFPDCLQSEILALLMDSNGLGEMSVEQLKLMLISGAFTAIRRATDARTQSMGANVLNFGGEVIPATQYMAYVRESLEWKHRNDPDSSIVLIVGSKNGVKKAVLESGKTLLVEALAHDLVEVGAFYPAFTKKIMGRARNDATNEMGEIEMVFAVPVPHKERQPALEDIPGRIEGLSPKYLAQAERYAAARLGLPLPSLPQRQKSGGGASPNRKASPVEMLMAGGSIQLGGFLGNHSR